MKYLKYLFIVLVFSFNAVAYGQAVYTPQSEALKLFNRDKRAIEKKNDGIIDSPNTVTGDINGDNLPDCIISYVITPKDGGNMIIGHECLIYLNTGKGMQPAGKFPDFKFCYNIDHISKGLIYIKQYECAPPYNTFTKNSILAYKNGKIIQVPMLHK